MASEAETRKAMSDFGVKGKHLQDMVQSFGRGFKKADEPKKDDKKPPAPQLPLQSRSQRRYGGSVPPAQKKPANGGY